ncbi:hypothetical protein COBT_003920 [Conglomerata obtusa]
MFSFRIETMIPHEYVYDETKNYHSDQLYYKDSQYENITYGMKRLGICEHCITRENYSFKSDRTYPEDIISHSNSLVFMKAKKS